MCGASYVGPPRVSSLFCLFALPRGAGPCGGVKSLTGRWVTADVWCVAPRGDRPERYPRLPHPPLPWRRPRCSTSLVAIFVRHTPSWPRVPFACATAYLLDHTTHGGDPGPPVAMDMIHRPWVGTPFRVPIAHASIELDPRDASLGVQAFQNL